MPFCPDHSVTIGSDRWCELCSEFKPKESPSEEASRMKTTADKRNYIIFLLIAQLVGFSMMYYGWW